MSRLRVISLMSLVWYSFSTISYAQSPVQDCSMTQTQHNPIEAALGNYNPTTKKFVENGETVALWANYLGNTPSSWKLRANKNAISGTALWGSNGIDVFPDASVPASPYETGKSMIHDETGGVFIAWSLCCSGGATGIAVYAQRLGSDGSLLWGNAGKQLAVSSGSQVGGACGLSDPPELVSDGAGGVIVAWEWNPAPNLPNTNDHILVQRLDGNGNPLWGSGGITLPYVDTEYDDGPLFTTDNNGGAFVTYASGTSLDNSKWYTRMQHIASDGTTWATAKTLGPGRSLSTLDGSSPAYRGIAKDPSGGAYVNWMNPQNTLWMQRVSPDGDFYWVGPGDSLAAQSTNPGPIHLTDDGQGNAIVVFNKSQTDLITQKVDSTGASLWRVNLTNAGGTVAPSLVNDGSGGATITWTTGNVSTNNTARVYGQHINSQGNMTWLPTGPDTSRNKGVLVASNAMATNATDWSYHNYNATARDTIPLTVLAWSDSLHIDVQRINPNGALGFINTPVAPTLSSPSNGAINQTLSGTLSWLAASGATGYDVYLDGNNPPTTRVSSNQPGLTYHYSGLANNTPYYWTVVAKNSVGSTPAVAPWSFTTVVAAPSTFALLSPANGGTGQALTGTLSWGASSNATGYDVYMDTNPSPSTLVSSNQPGTTYDFPSLSYHTTYYWGVVARNAGGTLGATGAPWHFTTLIAAPGPFALLSPANGATGQTVSGTLTWAASSDAAGYDVYLDTNNPPTTMKSSNQPGTSYPYSGLAPDTTYYWGVVARNTTGTRTATGSPWSFSVPPNIMLPISGQRGWNMISIPVALPSSTSYHSIFPTGNGLYDYNNGYRSQDTINTGRGYWIKFSESVIDSVSGQPELADTINVKLRWNMIGVGSFAVPVDSIQSDSPDMIVSPAWGYQPGSGYVKSDTLYPGCGYWLKAHQDGKLIFTRPQEGSLAKTRARANPVRVVPDEDRPPPFVNDQDSQPETPTDYALEQNYPNPFNPTTTLKYQLPADSRVKINVYNVLSQVVQTLVDGVESAGYKSIEWNASSVGSGIYFYRIEATGASDPTKSFTQVKKMLLLK